MLPFENQTAQEKCCLCCHQATSITQSWIVFHFISLNMSFKWIQEVILIWKITSTFKLFLCVAYKPPISPGTELIFIQFSMILLWTFKCIQGVTSTWKMALLWIIRTSVRLNFLEWPAGFFKMIHKAIPSTQGRQSYHLHYDEAHIEITVTDTDDIKAPQVYRACQKWGSVSWKHFLGSFCSASPSNSIRQGQLSLYWVPVSSTLEKSLQIVEEK